MKKIKNLKKVSNFEKGQNLLHNSSQEKFIRVNLDYGLLRINLWKF